MIAMELRWEGPFSCPGFEGHTGLPRVPRTSGIYLFTVEHPDSGFILYCPGLTRRPFTKRFHERLEVEIHIQSISPANRFAGLPDRGM